MSIETIKEQINLFLENDEPEVLAIKGDWGVGKTYSWNKFLKEARNKNKVKLSKYSYVSLFGINSLESLKKEMFENVLSRDMIGEKVTLDTFQKNAMATFGTLGRKSAGIFNKSLPFLKDFSSAVESLAFLSLSKTIICIDDLERRGSDLNVKDILGLITLLKEQKNCKVVVLLNDGREELEEYFLFKEKVIDIELKFHPSASESAVIAYTSSNSQIQSLGEFTEKLDIRNIRVLKKIEKLYLKVIPFLKGVDDVVVHQVKHSLVILSWSYYCSGTNEDIPKFEFITSSKYNIYGLGKEDDDDVGKRWKNTLQRYQYTMTDGLDNVIASAVTTGYFENEALIEELKIKSDSLNADKVKKGFSDAWRLYHDSFSDNGAEFVTTLHEKVKENIKFVSFSEFNSTVRIFRKLGESSKASELIDLYVASRQKEIILMRVKDTDIIGDTVDMEMAQKFKEIYDAHQKEETAEKVLGRISGKNGWSQEDEKVLSETSSDEYYKLFKSIDGEHLSSFVSTVLQYGHFSSPSATHMKIYESAAEALRKIARESKINELRVLKYNISIEGKKET